MSSKLSSNIPEKKLRTEHSHCFPLSLIEMRDNSNLAPGLDPAAAAMVDPGEAAMVDPGEGRGTYVKMKFKIK